MIGSAMVFEAESLDAVRKVIEADIYYTSGVVSVPTWSASSRVCAGRLTGAWCSGTRRSSWCCPGCPRRRCRVSSRSEKSRQLELQAEEYNCNFTYRRYGCVHEAAAYLCIADVELRPVDCVVHTRRVVTTNIRVRDLSCTIYIKSSERTSTLLFATTERGAGQIGRA